MLWKWMNYCSGTCLWTQATRWKKLNENTMVNKCSTSLLHTCVHVLSNCNIIAEYWVLNFLTSVNTPRHAGRSPFHIFTHWNDTHQRYVLNIRLQGIRRDSLTRPNSSHLFLVHDIHSCPSEVNGRRSSWVFLPGHGQQQQFEHFRSLHFVCEYLL